MAESPFTNREIQLMFEQINDKLDNIHQQTQRTNGRLLKVEEKATSLEKEHITAKAYAVAVSVFIGALVTVGNFALRLFT